MKIEDLKKHSMFFISLKVILKNEKGEILLLKEGINTTMYGFYDLPGGRITADEINDSFDKAIAREIREELGEIQYELNPRPISYGVHSFLILETNKEEHAFWLCFEAKYISGEINISKEHTGYIWQEITHENLSTYFTKGALDCMTNYLKFNKPK